MNTRVVILTILALLQLGVTHGQHPVFRSYSMSDGLSNNSIRKIYQDSQGFIWICTWEGLNKFEGHKFTQYTTGNGLPHSMVNDVIEISPGVIMVAMNDGSISYIRNGRLDPHTNQTRYIVNQFVIDPGSGLLGASDSFGILRISDSRILQTPDSLTHSLYQIIPWKDYFITIGDPSPVLVYDKKMRVISTASVKTPFPHCIYKLRNDQLLIGTELGLYTLDMSDPTKPVAKRPIAPFDHPVIQNNPVNSIMEDHLGNIWIGTYSGLVMVSPAGISRVFTEKDGLPGNRITYITSDAEKNTWVGTYSGLAKLPYQSLDVMVPGNGLAYKGALQHISRLNPTQLVVTAKNGIYSYDTEQEAFNPIMDLEPGYFAVYISGSDPFSVTYKDKIYSWNEGLHTMEPRSGFRSSYYYFAAQYKTTICATDGHLKIRFANGNVITAIDSIRIHTITWDKKGRILAGAWNKGLYRVTIDTIKQVVTEIEDFSSVPFLSYIRSLHTDPDNNIWAGTRYNGVIILTEKEKGKFDTKRLSQSTGLISDWIHYIMEAPDGNIWLGSLTGLSKVIVSDKSYRVFNFSKATGFYSSISGLVCMGKEQFWGTSDNGLFKFRDLQLENTPPLPVYFTDIRLGNADSSFTSPEPGRKIILGYNENYLRFEFASPGFINEKEIYYSYHLRGSHDTSWTAPSNRHAVEFASLSPGKYVFEVKMKGWNGVYGPVTSFAFTIKAPFWLSWWFFLAAAMIVTLVVLSIIRYRTKQLLKLQKVRNSIATDLHDDIGSSLTNISILSQLSLDSMGQQEQTKKFIHRIRDEVLSSNQALDDIIWSVNTLNDTLDETLARMRRYVGDVFDNSSTKYHLDIANNGIGQKIHMEQRRDLFLIFKEALNNIHKHAGPANVWIKIAVSHHWIRMSVKDDGAGFDTSVQTHRNGLKNMRARVDKWKGKFEVRTGPAKGTNIEISLPILTS